MSAKNDTNMKEAMESMSNKMVENIKKNQSNNVVKGTRISRMSHLSTRNNVNINIAIPEELMIGKGEVSNNAKPSVHLKRASVRPKDKNSSCNC